MAGCRSTSIDRLDKVVALAIDGLANTMSSDGWSRACAQLPQPDSAREPIVATVKIGWEGTLHAYASIPDAEPIVGLADEAFAFDAGHQIALRSGELVAVVSFSGSTAFDLEAWARQVAVQLQD